MGGRMGKEKAAKERSGEDAEKKKQKGREKKQGKREAMGLRRPFEESLVMSYA